MTACGGSRRAWCGAAVALALAGVGLSAAAAEPSLDRSPPLYRPGERPVLSHVPGDAAHVLVQDWRGREARRLGATSGRSGLVLPALPAGYYEVVAAGRRRAFAVLEPPTRSSRTFGVMTHFAQGWDPGLVPWIARAGIGTVRDEQYWAQIEPQPGEYADPERYARYMRALRQADIEPLLVLSFANPYYDDGQTPFSAAGRAAFAAYGAKLVRRHGGQITAVEVWNEINGTFCSGPCRQDRAGTYAALLADSYAALKAANPDLTVVGGAAVKVPLPWFDALIARGAAAHWDAVAVHPYTEDPEGAARDIDALRQRLRAAGSEAPIWVTEFGTGAGRADAVARRATAAYLVRMAVVLRAAGVERLYWYLLRDYQNFDGMGLLRGEDDPLGRLAPTPAYVAYATLIRLLDGADSVRREPTDPRTHIYRFERGGEATYVLWAPDGPVAVSADLPAGAVLTDLVGATRQLPAGTRTLTLDRDPVYLRGAVRHLDATRPDTLVADARGDFSVEAAGGRWQYGAFLMPTRGPLPRVCSPPLGVLQPLKRRASRWEYFYGHPRWPILRVGKNTLHPASYKEGAVWAVRRYRPDMAASLRVNGAFTRNGQGDGTGVCVLLDGRPVFEAMLKPGSRQRSDFDLRLLVNADSVIDFVATPGLGSGIDYDAVGLSARISLWPDLR